MASALTVAVTQSYSAGITDGVVSVAGNGAGNTIPLAGNPRLGLILLNTTAGVLTATVNVTTGHLTFNGSVTKTISVPAAIAGRPGVNFVVFDNSTALDAGSGSVSMTGAGLATLYVQAVRWNSPR